MSDTDSNPHDSDSYSTDTLQHEIQNSRNVDHIAIYSSEDDRSESESYFSKFDFSDSVSDLKSDLESDSETDVESDSESNLESDSETDVESDSETDVESDLESDVESDSETDVESDSETDVESDSETDVESDSESDVESDSESDLESDSETDVESESGGSVDSDRGFLLVSDRKSTPRNSVNAAAVDASRAVKILDPDSIAAGHLVHIDYTKCDKCPSDRYWRKNVKWGRCRKNHWGEGHYLLVTKVNRNLYGRPIGILGCTCTSLGQRKNLSDKDLRQEYLLLEGGDNKFVISIQNGKGKPSTKSPDLVFLDGRKMQKPTYVENKAKYFRLRQDSGLESDDKAPILCSPPPPPPSRFQLTLESLEKLTIWSEKAYCGRPRRPTGNA